MKKGEVMSQELKKLEKYIALQIIEGEKLLFSVNKERNYFTARNVLNRLDGTKEKADKLTYEVYNVETQLELLGKVYSRIINIDKWEIEKGNRNPSGLKLHQIAKHLDTTTEFLTDDTKDSMEKSSKEQVLLRKYRSLNDKDKERIEKILDILMLNEG